MRIPSLAFCPKPKLLLEFGQRARVLFPNFTDFNVLDYSRPMPH